MSDSPPQPAADTPERRRTSSRDILRAIADERRRITLSVLADASTPIDARTVARRVAAREGTEDVTTDRIEDIHVSLHHIHLPALADVGLTTYDAERGIVDDAVEDAEAFLA